MDLSRRDDRTQPGVLTPGYQCKERPALKGRKIVLAERKLESELRAQINETRQIVNRITDNLDRYCCAASHPSQDDFSRSRQNPSSKTGLGILAAIRPGLIRLLPLQGRS
jgi:hypothetical protein